MKFSIGLKVRKWDRRIRNNVFNQVVHCPQTLRQIRNNMIFHLSKTIEGKSQLHGIITTTFFSQIYFLRTWEFIVEIFAQQFSSLKHTMPLYRYIWDANKKPLFVLACSPQFFLHFFYIHPHSHQSKFVL